MNNIEDLVFGISGTPGFRAPEQCNAENGYGELCDVWGLGLTLYVFLNNGIMPWWAESEIELDISNI